jgi:hypothetical protein
MTTFDLIQWVGIWLFVFGVLVGMIGWLLCDLLDLRSYVPDAFLLTARIVMPVGAALAMVGLIFSHAS